MSPDDAEDLDEEPGNLHVDVQIQSSPARVKEPNDAVRHGLARLVRYSEEGEPGAELATLKWMHVEYAYGVDHGVDGFEIADAESQELHDLHCVLFDQGTLRAPFDEMGGLGHDLIVLERLDVLSGEHFEIYSAELIEHVLRRWSQGCFAAVYIEDRPMNPRLVEVLTSRGFRWHKTPNLGIYVADTGALRPELPGEPKRSPALRLAKGPGQAH
jgi:hypothetical protein